MVFTGPEILPAESPNGPFLNIDQKHFKKELVFVTYHECLFQMPQGSRWRCCSNPHCHRFLGHTAAARRVTTDRRKTRASRTGSLLDKDKYTRSSFRFANTTKYSHITPVRKALHWLSIKYRSICKDCPCLFISSYTVVTPNTLNPFWYSGILLWSFILLNPMHRTRNSWQKCQFIK